ncbi:Protein CBG03379 [Caenorhabditis briggsae]|uniref:Protein CBG03379 n=1 Tax=Caenorhabditis briggsae TaxID=6238 RepID=A8WUW9_CAEBR|nr:Protein CBG03379 [Caenorhabditis briggsae]CAP24280.2 Protein CBG03379 [Caenorhabditis briggsae]
MFLNHRPVLVFLLFLAASPVDVVSRVLYSDSIYQDGYPVNETLRLDPLQLDLNPLHLLCPVCSIMQDVLGLVTGLVLGGGLLKHVGITVCSIGLSSTIKIPILPNALCAAIFEVVKDDDVRNILRNFVAALQFHLDHRKEYLAITSLNV